MARREASERRRRLRMILWRDRVGEEERNYILLAGEVFCFFVAVTATQGVVEAVFLNLGRGENIKAHFGLKHITGYLN